MATRNFILRCKRTLNDCTRLLLSDSPGPDVLQSTLMRLETMQMSLEWARGRLVNVSAADQLINDIAEYCQEVRTNPQLSQQASSGYQAPLTWSGTRGRPHYSISRDQLSFLSSCGFTVPQIADILQVSLSTVKRRLRHFSLLRSGSYSEMSDSALDDMIKDLIAGNNQLGPEAVRAQLRATGIRVQRCRVRASMRRINPTAAALRAMSHTLHRRAYRVAGPNSLWHLDGNHKLIRWRIVIHGGIDGYSRLIVFLHASNNNRSSTVMDSFIHAVGKYGVPSRIRTDRGGENNAVCLLMNIFRGSDRGSALRGRSTHNQRIERLWGDLWRGLTNVYHDLFSFLESEYIVDINNEMHLWALHYVYLPRINRDLDAFVHQWNSHGLRTERHQSPMQIFVRGCLEQQGRTTTAMRDLFSTSASTSEGSMQDVPAAGSGEAPIAGVTPLVDWPERVTVPQNEFTLDPAHMEQLLAQFDPLGGPRTQLGLDILQDLISFLGSVNQ